MPSRITKKKITKHYMVTLKPSVRKKLAQIAKESNYKSDSKLVNKKDQSYN